MTNTERITNEVLSRYMQDIPESFMALLNQHEPACRCEECIYKHRMLRQPHGPLCPCNLCATHRKPYKDAHGRKTYGIDIKAPWPFWVRLTLAWATVISTMAAGLAVAAGILYGVWWLAVRAYVIYRIWF